MLMFTPYDIAHMGQYRERAHAERIRGSTYGFDIVKVHPKSGVSRSRIARLFVCSRMHVVIIPYIFVVLLVIFFFRS